MGTCTPSSEDNIWQQVLSFPHVGPGEGAEHHQPCPLVPLPLAEPPHWPTIKSFLAESDIYLYFAEDILIFQFCYKAYS